MLFLLLFTLCWCHLVYPVSTIVLVSMYYCTLTECGAVHPAFRQICDLRGVIFKFRGGHEHIEAAKLSFRSNNFVLLFSVQYLLLIDVVV